MLVSVHPSLRYLHHHKHVCTRNHDTHQLRDIPTDPSLVRAPILSVSMCGLNYAEPDSNIESTTNSRVRVLSVWRLWDGDAGSLLMCPHLTTTSGSDGAQ